ncbi:hypothetical protein F5Y18DRAFT_218045 [Xylariaceae sp. FL1019]|nr:hypothetical protein F5Y18DRAFT_218045 [Xylariaceae sp. FL1019]
MSTGDHAGLYDQKVSEFLDSYRKHQKHFDQLLKLVREQCEHLLEHASIKAIVQARMKRIHSLEKKLEGLKHEPVVVSNDVNDAPNFRGWVVSGQEILDHPDMGDLVGIRIGLYFPDDIPKVVQIVEDSFDTKWLFGTVSGGRQGTQGRNVNIEQHMKGPWRSLSPSGAEEHWEHSGYKSWQVVVGLRSPPTHFERSRVEIQIGTVVTQAWAEVQHNIIYKRSASVLATPTMKRMIDAINGLAITTDIMLKELERDLEDAEREADRQPFKNGAELMDWFESTYLSKMGQRERQIWREAQREFVVDLMIKSHESKGPLSSLRPEDRRIFCREECKRLVEASEMLYNGMLKHTHLRSDITLMLWVRQDKVSSGPEPVDRRLQTHK